MLAVEKSYRGMGLGTKLVRTVVRVMQEKECDEVRISKTFNIYFS